MEGAEGGSGLTSLVLMMRQDKPARPSPAEESLVTANTSSSGMCATGTVPTRASKPYSRCCELCIQAGAALNCAAKSRQRLNL